MSAAAGNIQDDDRPTVFITTGMHLLLVHDPRAHKQTEERMHKLHTQTGDQRFVNSSLGFTFITIFLLNRRYG